MNPLIRLYPKSFRDHWADEMEAEIRRAGPSSWPDVVLGAARMWAHPALWPADQPVQRQSRLTATGFAAGLAGLYLVHLILEMDDAYHPGPVGSAMLAGGSALIALGALLLAPRPRVAALLPYAVKALVLPAVLIIGLVVLANRTSITAVDQPLAGSLVSLWWLSLALAGFRGFRVLLAGLAGGSTPSPLRLRLGLSTLTAGTVVAATALLAASTSGTQMDSSALVSGVVQLGLGSMLVIALKDLSQLAPAE